MSLKYRCDNEGTLVINIEERFDISLQREFRKSYEVCDSGKKISKVIIDLKDAYYIDSSALGMLLQLKRHLGFDREYIEITHCCEKIMSVLTVAKFGELFTIEP